MKSTWAYIAKLVFIQHKLFSIVIENDPNPVGDVLPHAHNGSMLN